MNNMPEKSIRRLSTAAIIEEMMLVFEDNGCHVLHFDDDSYYDKLKKELNRRIPSTEKKHG